ncbi:MAG: GyrI-like domain-containing protein [Tannerellaceae bacterium]|nr:GyrI-like domain-containing protein [Tannerellaceae bacterium]
MKINSTEIKNLEPIQTIAITHVGEYSGIGGAFEKLAAWADANNLWVNSPKLTGIYHDNPMDTPVEKLRSDACIENLSGIQPGEGMKEYTISGGKYFVMQVELSMPEYYEAWQKAYTAVTEQGYECDMRDHYELYVTCCDMEDPNATSIVDLCIPVK